MATQDQLELLKICHNINYVLPPYTGDPRDRKDKSPYDLSILDIVDMYSYSNDRVDILNGLLDYRRNLNSIIPLGINGFQWLAGSFTQNTELSESRAPHDIDVVTVLPLNAIKNDDVIANMNLFDAEEAKKTFKVDAHFMDLNNATYYIIYDAIYWFGLFGHTRDKEWKGFYRVPLYEEPTDIEARNILRGRP